MTFLDLLRGVTHTFASNRVRALLTLLGVMIGTGSIVMLAGLLTSAESALVKLNQGVNESDTLRIRTEDAPQHQRDKATRPLSREDGRALGSSPQLPGVDVVVEARREAVARHRGREKRVRIMGVDEAAQVMYRLEVEKGRSLVPDDLTQGRRVAVIGQEVFTELLDSKADILGTQLTVDGQSWTIVGVLAHKPVMGAGTGTWMWNRRMLVPRTAFDAVFTPTHDVDSIFLRVRGRSPSERWMSAIGAVSRSILLRRHLGVKNFDVEDKTGEKQERLILDIIQILLLATGLLAMFVGGINIMNIMLVTVTERTHEIGLRRAIGASPRSILMQFLLESATVSLFGGALGVIGGLALSWLIGLGLASAFGEWRFVVVPWSIAAGLGLALATGVVFGLFPAWRAARLSPVDALRTE